MAYRPGTSFDPGSAIPPHPGPDDPDRDDSDFRFLFIKNHPKLPAKYKERSRGFKGEFFSKTVLYERNQCLGGNLLKRCRECRIFNLGSANREDNGVSDAFGLVPPLGAHTSIAGGVFQAIRAGREIRADVVQIFSKNQMQWRGRWYSTEELETYFRLIEETGIRPVTIHTAYLINLASVKEPVARRSFEAFVDELLRAHTLKVPFLVLHPGSHLGEGEPKGVQTVARQLRRGFEASGVDSVTVLLESTAGQGTNLGYRFEHLRDIIAASGCEERLGVCLDTCHLYAAGYDLRTPEAWEQTFTRFDALIGREKLHAFHLNDSLKPLGSRRDRHARIGQGELGRSAFQVLLNDPRLEAVPMILEVPGGNAAYAEDLLLLRRWIRKHTESNGTTP